MLLLYKQLVTLLPLIPASDNNIHYNIKRKKSNATKPLWKEDCSYCGVSSTNLQLCNDPDITIEL